MFEMLFVVFSLLLLLRFDDDDHHQSTNVESSFRVLTNQLFDLVENFNKIHSIRQ